VTRTQCALQVHSLSYLLASYIAWFVRDVCRAAAEIVSQLKSLFDDVERDEVAVVDSLLMRVDENALTHSHTRHVTSSPPSAPRSTVQSIIVHFTLYILLMFSDHVIVGDSSSVVVTKQLNTIALIS